MSRFDRQSDNWKKTNYTKTGFLTYLIRGRRKKEIVFLGIVPETVTPLRYV